MRGVLLRRRRLRGVLLHDPSNLDGHRPHRSDPR